ncbi:MULTISPECIES: NAD(P)H-dependent glycerol-3-phosphate dehydrogenase [Clostridium]|uniref:Glycerol-3-phosphate dehydrogenase [NAD(P)+] n=1 Tax=Clostridium senegalense TaxID=1465809 RepID=A0A6M0GZ79_9CLOT|nr:MULTISPECIES: NAD(P)H-dependent glycerol-3-phosphate dehydrogenase [Clostridium]NEU03254.1 NAD(P)H-dependent glycerol-3-phosphate dehydrogenase [Clostridium senegalense]
MEKVSILGAGSFGSALGVMLAKKGVEVSIWAHKKETIEDINKKRENIKYLPNVTIPSNMIGYNDMEGAVKESSIIVLAVPSHAIRDISKQLSTVVNKNQIIVTVAKGLESGTLKRMSEIIDEEIKVAPVVVLSGPSHAEEVAVDIPTTVVVSSLKMEAAEKVQDVFMSNKFRVYTNDDLIGVEIGGACKNIIALAAGISDGIGYGDNAKAALMTRGMHEIMKIGIKLGGKPETFNGLTGFGDLIVTCTSVHSRNRRAGILIGKGMSMDEAVENVGMVVEGIKACKAFYELKEKENITMPITDVLYKVLFENKDPKYGVYELMSRNKKRENGIYE